MEAATPLRKPHVRTLGDHVIADGLVIDDDCAVRLVRDREEAGDDPARLVLDAVEIGARVLDREQAGANAEFVRGELEKVSREIEHVFADRARETGEKFARQVEDVFGPESGHVTKLLQRHFGDESSSAVQNRVREMLQEVGAKQREDIMRLFSSAEGSNPLAQFTARTVATLKDAGERQDRNLLQLQERMALLQRELQALRDEREKRDELEAERERGTAKGRTFEELVAEAVDEIAVAQGDDCDAVGDLKGATRKTGDIVVAIDACRGPARGRVVFEAKNSRLSKPEALRELDRGLAERDADFGVLVVPSEDKVPARMHALREYNGDKLIVTLDPESDERLALEVGYALARARVLMARGDDDAIDAAAVRERVERALQGMDDVRRVKNQLTGAKTSIDKASELIDSMAESVREQLKQIDRLASAAGGEAAAAQAELLD